MPKFLSLEIGNTEIKLCEIFTTKEGALQVNQTAIAELPDMAIEDGLIRDMPGVAEAVGKALSASAILTKDVVFTVSSTKIMSKEVTIPYIKGKKKILDLVTANAGEYFPVSVDNCVLAYSVLETIMEEETSDEEITTEGEKKSKPKAKQPKPKKIRLVAYAVSSDIVKGLYDLANFLKLKLVSIDYSGNSITQICDKQVTAEPSIVVLLDRSSTVVSVYNNNILILQRTIAHGAFSLIEAVKDVNRCTTEEAIEILSKVSLSKLVRDDRINDSLYYLFSNLQRIKEYIKNKYPDISIDKAYLLSTIIKIEKAEELFSEQLGMETVLIKELNGVIPVNTETVPPESLITYVLSIGAVINPVGFVPREYEEDLRKKKRNAMYRSCIFASLFVGLILVMLPLLQYLQKTGERDDLNEDIARIEDITKIIERYNLTTALKDDILVLDSLTENATERLYDFIQAIEVVKPSNLQLMSLSCSDGNISMQVITDSKEATAKFIIALKEIAYIDEVWTSGLTEAQTELDGVNKVSFMITCSISKYDKGVE